MENYFAENLNHYCHISVKKCSKMEKGIIDYYDLTFVLEGSMTYIVNNKAYTLNKNDAVFIPPYTLRERPAGTEHTEYVSFNFYLFQGKELNYMKGCISAEIRKLISAYPHSHILPSFHSREKLTNILNCILFELTDFASLKTNNEHVIKITRYIENNLTERITLNDLSVCTNLSPVYVSYIFKKEMNKPLTEYINERKLLFAKELIQVGEMSLTEIASYLGFENYNYFSRLFKKHFKITPVALKKKR